MRMKLPKLPSVGGIVGDLQKGLIAAGVLAGTYIAANWVGRQASRLPLPVPPFVTKLGVALGVVYLSRMVVRDPGLRKVSLAGAFFPLTLEAISMVAPGLASQVLMPSASLPGPIPGSDIALGMPPGNRLSDYTLDAELEAELDMDSEFGAF